MRLRKLIQSPVAGGTSRPAFALFTIEPMEVTVRKLILASVLAIAGTAVVVEPTQAQFLFSPFGGYNGDFFGGFGGFPPPYRHYYNRDYYGDQYYAEQYRPYYRYHHRHYYRHYRHHRHHHHRHYYHY